jgi:hypothetical protein
MTRSGHERDNTSCRPQPEKLMNNSGTFTVLSTFEDAGTAQHAVDSLVKEGFLPQNMRIERSGPTPAGSAAPADRGSAAQHGIARIERLFDRLLGRTEHAHRARDYSHAVSTGRAVVLVDTSSEVAAERAATVMQQFGGYDLTERRASDTGDGESISGAGEQSLPDGTIVRWRAAQVVYRHQGAPVASLDGE